MNAAYDAVVYDLDGTLVQLAVDWDEVASAVADVLREAGADPDDTDLWGMLPLADEAGVADAVEATISDFERTGARESRRLPVADELPRAVPVGVCSLNCEAACRLALETHDLASAVETVVGRDSVVTQKPDPGPLLAAVDDLGVDPESTLFVGNSPRDAETAAAAGTDFEYVRDR